MTDQLMEELIDVLVDEFKTTLPEFYKEWKIIGFDDATQKKFGEAVLDHQKNLLTDMLTEIKQRKEKLIKSVKLTSQKIKSISKDLHTEVDLGCEDMSLIDAEKHLRLQLNQLEEVKEARISQLKELFNKETEICAVMGNKPVGLDSTIPSEEELQNYEVYISNQEAEMVRLKTIFKEIRTKIVKAMDELGYAPKLDFERNVVNDHHNFIFTSTNMEKLYGLRDEMNEKLSIAKDVSGQKRQELLTLYEFLEVSKDTYEEILKNNSGCDAETIANLSKEIKKCKEIKMRNISKFIENVREKIRQLWDQCMYGEEQREDFKAYHYQTYNEEILTLHELEMEELKRFYERNENIFNLFHQEEEMNQKMVELDLRAEDPNRLNNRGGQLLEEEKARKEITKKLPKVKTKLTEFLEEFEAKNGYPFTFHGLTYEEYEHQRITQFNQQKENLKLAKARAKDEKSAKKTPLSASRRNIAMSLRTTQSSVKRKLPMDKSPCVTGSNKKRLVQSEKTRPILGSKVRRSGKVSRRLLSNSLKESPKKSWKAQKLSISDVSNNSSLNHQHYQEFQEHISSRNELRSTLISEQLLKVVKGEGKKMKTPVKTPVKPLRKHLINANTPRVTPRAGPSNRPPRSPKITTTPRLTVSNNGLTNLKL